MIKSILLILVSLVFLNATTIKVEKANYNTGEQILVQVTDMLADAQDWVGIYPKNSTNEWENVVSWAWTKGIKNGNVVLHGVIKAGEYQARAFFKNSFHTEATDDFTAVEAALNTTITTSKSEYEFQEPIVVTLANMLADPNDWVGIYPKGSTNEWKNVVSWAWTKGIKNGDVTLDGVFEGEYEARAFFENSFHTEAIHNFKVKAAPLNTTIKVEKNEYYTDEKIVVNLTDMLADAQDWVGIYPKGSTNEWKNVASWAWTKGIKKGSVDLKEIAQVGEYEARAFFKNSFHTEATDNFTIIKRDPCSILRNAGFEQDIDSWQTYGDEVVVVDDSYKGQKALRIVNGGFEQVSNRLDKIDTYQFNGYYKTEGEFEGNYAGMSFYDAQNNLLFTKSIALGVTNEYKKFVINATTDVNLAYIKVWVASESQNGGKILFDNVRLSASECYNYTVASSLPPKGLKPNQVPQFVTIGFDDNTKSEGIEWALSMFKDKKNHDGSKARVSFFMNTNGFSTWIEDDPQKLVEAVKKLKNSSHEIGNHTDNHHANIQGDNWESIATQIRNLNLTKWTERIVKANNDLVNIIGLNQNRIKGFRSPFLLYNQNTMEALKQNSFLYDCSIEEGYSTEFNGKNFRWPYQLNEGSPGHNENWYGNPNNPDFVALEPIKGLWELPNYLLMVPKDNECAAYGIEAGLWNRLLQKLPYLEGHKITGFDYNLWSIAELNKAEVLGLLKYNLDLRLQGNRAPFMFGAHTQFYTQEWAEAHAKNATVTQMREAISEFIDYALSFDVVRIRPAGEIIKWCANPVALQ